MASRPITGSYDGINGGELPNAIIDLRTTLDIVKNNNGEITIADNSSKQIRLIKYCGKGSFGEVYKVGVGKEILAMKILLESNPFPHDEIDKKTRFEEEIKILARLTNVCGDDGAIAIRYHGDGVILGHRYVLMEFADGSLFDLQKDAVGSDNLLTADEALREGALIIERAIKTHKIIDVPHRDIRSDNILVIKKGGIRSWVLSDFGLALNYRSSIGKRLNNDCPRLVDAPEERRHGFANDIFAVVHVVFSALVNCRDETRLVTPDVRSSIEEYLESDRRTKPAKERLGKMRAVIHQMQFPGHLQYLGKVLGTALDNVTAEKVADFPPRPNVEPAWAKAIEKDHSRTKRFLLRLATVVLAVCIAVIVLYVFQILSIRPASSDPGAAVLSSEYSRLWLIPLILVFGVTIWYVEKKWLPEKKPTRSGNGGVSGQAEISGTSSPTHTMGRPNPEVSKKQDAFVAVAPSVLGHVGINDDGNSGLRNDDPITAPGQAWTEVPASTMSGMRHEHESYPSPKAQEALGSSPVGDEHLQEAPRPVDAKPEDMSPPDRGTKMEIQGADSTSASMGNNVSHASSAPAEQIADTPNVHFIIVGPFKCGKTELRRTMLIYTESVDPISRPAEGFHYIGMRNVHGNHLAALGSGGLPKDDDFAGRMFLHDADARALEEGSKYVWIGDKKATPFVESRMITISVDGDITQQLAIDTPGEDWETALKGEWDGGRFRINHGVDWTLNRRRVVVNGLTDKHRYWGKVNDTREFLERYRIICGLHVATSPDRVQASIDGVAHASSIVMIAISHETLTATQTISGKEVPHQEFLSWLMQFAIVTFNYSDDDIAADGAPGSPNIIPMISVIVTNRRGEFNEHSHNSVCISTPGHPSQFVTKCHAGLDAIKPYLRANEDAVTQKLRKRLERFHIYPVRGWNAIDPKGNPVDVTNEMDSRGNAVRTAFVRLGGRSLKFSERGDPFSEDFISDEGKTLFIHKQFVCEGVPYLMHRILNTYRAQMASRRDSNA